MRWQLKALAQATLSRLPHHQRVYRWLHDTFGRSSRSLSDQLDRKLRLLARMRAAGLRIEGKVVLEVGTGWHPVLPVLLYLGGARRVLTLDVNPWLTLTTLGITLKGVAGEAARVAEELGASEMVVRDRLQQLFAALAEPHATPRSALESCRVEYRMPCDAANTGLPSGSVDYVISANVLEHIPSRVIEAIFAEAHRLLRPDGTMYHHVNPGDHFAVDPRITTVNFLRYSRRAWYLIGGSGVAYHNRLRCVDYIRLVEDAHFEITGTYSSTDSRALRQLVLGAIQVDSDFLGYTPEQLSCDIIGIFARPRPEGIQSLARTE